MKLNKLFMMLTLLVLLGTTAFAQTTWYVNNQIGNDGRNGLSATIPSPDDFVTGPKKTIGGLQGAQAAGVNGDVIIVAYTGVAYGVATTEPNPITITKKLTLQSTGGAAEISSLFAVATGALANKVVFNSGAFTLSGGLTLTSGTLDNGAGLVTVKASTVTINAVATTAKVAGQLAYSGTVNFTYGAAYTTADEFPNSGTFGNLTSNAGGADVKLKSTSATMTGVFNTFGGGKINLGGNVLAITSTGNPTHDFSGGDVTNGTLAFSIGGTAAKTVTINGAVAIPTVTVVNSSDFAHTLAIAQPTAITGTLAVNGKVIVSTSGALRTIGTSGFSGDVVTMSSNGTLTLSGTGAAVNIYGNVLLNPTGLNASGAGQINFANQGAFTLTITGNVTNSAGIVLSGAAVSNAGVIAFSDALGTTVIKGSVILNGVLSGNSIAATNYTTNGEIRLGGAVNDNAITINGSVSNSATSTAVATVAGGTVSTNMRILFANAAANVRADGGIINSTQIPDVATSSIGATNANNGTILFTARAAGTIGISLGTRVGTVQNTSVSTVASNGLIDFGAAATGGFYGTNIVQGTAGKGGDISFGNHLIDISGNITNSRTDTGADILVPAGVGTVTHAIGGYIYNSGKSDISIDLTGNDNIGVTGRVENSAAGNVVFPVAGTGTITFGGLVVSGGKVTIPVTHNNTLTINGAVDIKGGEAELFSVGGNVITISGNASFTSGKFTTTGRAMVTINGTAITFGGATTNTTFSPAGTAIRIGNPTPTSLVTVTIGAFNPPIAGAFEVLNTTGLVPAVKFTGGTLGVAGALSFTTGVVTIADQAVITSNGVFTNAAGYTTTEQGRVVVAATGAGAFTGLGNYGAVEFLGAAPAAGTNTKLTGTIYLTAGAVGNGGNTITIDNSTTLPTIVRNNGSFAQLPNFASNVNVTYIGTDKASGNELPVAPSTKLQNLTVATTNGTTVAGKGVVTVGASTIVNGTIQVNASQTLLLDASTMTMNGASILLYGDIANEGVGLLEFAAATGTTVVGGGYLPNLQIAAGSDNNIISAKAIINQLVGTDNVKGAPGDDFVATTTAAQGSINFVAGTNKATFNIAGVAFDGSQAGAVTTNGTGNTMVLGSNFIATGTLSHNAGTIDVSAFTYEQRGAAINLGVSTDAFFAGTGLLKLYQKDATTNSDFTITSNAGGSAIAINTELQNAEATAANDDIVLAGGPLTIAGSFTITDGELQLGQDLTLTGSNFTIASAGSSSGAGVLRLNAATPPLKFTYGGAPTIQNLRISNDVNLDGTGTSLTVGTAFTHDGGTFNFGDRNITLTGAYTRTAGSYSAGNGYLIWNSAGAFAQGTGFSIPNLRVQATLAPAAENFVVEKNLYLDNKSLNHNNGSPRLTVGVASGVVPTITIVGAGALDKVPTFAQGTANYKFTGASIAITSNSVAVGNTVTLTTTNGHNLAAGQTITITGSAVPALNNSFTVAAVAGATFDVNDASLAAVAANATSGGVVSVNLVTVTNASNYWPSDPSTLANTLTISFLNTTDKVLFNDSRVVNGLSTLNLTKGILALANDKSLTLASGMTINKAAGATLTLDNDANPDNGTGSLIAPNVNLVYTGTQSVGSEYIAPVLVTNVTNNGGTGSGTLTIGPDNASNGIRRTISGDLTANSDVIINANTTISGQILVATGKTLTVNGILSAPNNLTISGTFAGTGAVNFKGDVTISGNLTSTGAFTFSGVSGQNLTLPSGTTTLQTLVLDMQGLNPILNVMNGDLKLADNATSEITFKNGILNMGTQKVILPRPALPASNSGLAYKRTDVTGDKVGHIVGKVQRAAESGDGASGKNGRFEFPVGTLSGKYRPVSITFTPDYVVGNPVDLIVSSIDASPEGTTGLSDIDGGTSIIDGQKIKIGAYPALYWRIATSPSSLSSTQKFDIDLTANSADFGYPYTSEQDLRMIRRQDGTSTTNRWTMQGLPENYANYQVVNSPTDAKVVVRTVSGQGGLVAEGSRFTFGFRAVAPTFGTTPTSFTVAAGATTNNTVQISPVVSNPVDQVTKYEITSGPTWAKINATTGLVTLTPAITDYRVAVYPVVIVVTTSTNLTASMTLNVTVGKSGLAPVFTAGYATTASVVVGNTLSLDIVATNPDNSDMTYSVAIAPVPVNPQPTWAAGKLTWSPTFADFLASKTYTVKVTATVVGGTPEQTATTTDIVVTVSAKYGRGDVNQDGKVAADDATLILKHVVGNPSIAADKLDQLWSANATGDVLNDLTINAYDAYFALYKSVNGSFPLAKMTAASGSVEFGKFVGEKGTFSLPINIQNTRGVLAVNSEVVLGSDVVYKGVSANLPEDWQVVSNFENGVLKVAMVGLTPLKDGAIANINIALKNPESSVSVTGQVTMNDVSASMQAVKVREIPSDFSLSQNYPNPFNPTTTIKYAISSDTRVGLVIYNILGQAVRTLVNADQEAGFYTAKWDGTNDFGSKVSSGVYIYRITAGNFVSTIKMNLLK